MATDPAAIEALAAAFDTPPAASRPWAFWFLNDDLDEAELVRQLEAFEQAGFGCVCPCARVGLGREVGYLTPRWFELLRLVVATCERLGLSVVLYDEASYPSGAANGLVAQESPEFAARCLVAATQRVDAGRRPVFARPNVGRGLWDRRVATVVVPLEDGRPSYPDARLVTPDAAGLVRLAPGTGAALVVALFDVPSGGTIRGAHPWQDDGSALAPAASDLLNPDAVAAFVRLTHDAYAAELGQWFGTTITALFTDEPDVLGRGARPDGVAWTPGLEHDLAEASGWSVEEVLRRLPELFDPDADGVVARVHADAVGTRLRRVYYGAQGAWCDAHSLALTGHPHEPDELLAFESFTWPGQDVVWRWVLPPTALSGPESASALAAASAAAQAGTPLAVTEVLGAYGWELTLDEVKWLVDWHAVRGTTAFCLHALFYSIRGNRAFESEPDVGLHNAWWPVLPTVLTYLGRLAEVGRAGPDEADVVVVCAGDRVPTETVAPLLRAGVDVHVAPLERVEVADGGLVRVGVRTYSTAVAPDALVADALAALGASGVVLAEGAWWEALEPVGDPFVVVSGAAADLRVKRRRIGGRRCFLLVNEGEGPLVLTLAAGVEAWDPGSGSRGPAGGQWELPRRGSVILWSEATGVAPRGLPVVSLPEAPPGPRTPPLALGAWSVEWPAGPDGLGDWTAWPSLETYAGSMTYRTTFDVTAPAELWLDLGEVGDIAEVAVNGEPVATLAWAPWACRVPASVVRAGVNALDVRVTNSSANRWQGSMRPSGLIGPVSLEVLS